MSTADTIRISLASGWPLDWLRRGEPLAVWDPESADSRIVGSLTLPGDMAKPSQLYRFADFEADVRARQVRKHGSKIKLQGQPFEMLLSLLATPGEGGCGDGGRIQYRQDAGSFDGNSAFVEKWRGDGRHGEEIAPLRCGSSSTESLRRPQSKLFR